MYKGATYDSSAMILLCTNRLKCSLIQGNYPQDAIHAMQFILSNSIDTSQPDRALFTIAPNSIMIFIVSNHPQGRALMVARML